MTPWKAALTCIAWIFLASACSDSTPPRISEPTDEFIEDPYSPPPLEYETMPPDYVVDGIELIDPDHQLQNLHIQARPVPLTQVDIHDSQLAGAWEISPSTSFEKPVYVRIPLEKPLPAGSPAALLYFNSASVPPEWQLQSLGRVLADGRHVIFAALHLSKQAITGEDATREAFLLGTACDGGVSSQVELYAYHERSCARNGGTCDEPTKPIAARMDPLVATSPTGPLFRLQSDPIINNNVVFKNEECRTCGEVACPISGCGEDEWASPAIYWPLRRLGEMIDKRSCGTVRLRVTESYDSCGEHSNTARHYVGRAVDLTLTRVVDGVPEQCSSLGHLGLLAALAEEAGFDFVFYENSLHVHASVDPYYYYFGTPRIFDRDDRTTDMAHVGTIDLESTTPASPPAASFIGAGDSISDPQGLACAGPSGLYVSRYEKPPHKASLSLLGATTEQHLAYLFDVTGVLNAFETASIARCGNTLYFNTPMVRNDTNQIVTPEYIKSIDLTTMHESSVETLNALVQSVACADDLLSFTTVPSNPTRVSLVQKQISGGQVIDEVFASPKDTFVSGFAQPAVAQCGDHVYYSSPQVLNSNGGVLTHAGLHELDTTTNQHRIVLEGDGEITAIACDGGKGVVFAEAQDGLRAVYLRRWTGHEQDIQSLGRIFSLSDTVNFFGSTPVASCKYVREFP